jgi:biopolymer transport protein ExbD
MMQRDDRTPVQIHLSSATLLPLLFLVVLLLMVPMVVTPAFVHHSYLPAAATANPLFDAHPEVALEFHGGVWFTSGDDWVRIPATSLVATLTEAYRGQLDPVLRVRAEPGTPYARILDVLGAAHAAGVAQIDLLAECPRGKESLRFRCHA